MVVSRKDKTINKISAFQQITEKKFIKAVAEHLSLFQCSFVST